MTFESGMRELEDIVARLEKGELSLEDSFTAFERGAQLSAALKKLLDAGDKRIRELTEAGERELDSK